VSHPSIEFITAHDINNPFENVIEAELMPLMQGIRS
jgi:hypothetical protein